MKLETGTLLALSGGGYRAMLFHVGALWRLNQLGELRKLTHVSSVSGGSIVAGLLAARWDKLEFDSQGIARRFGEEIATPLMRLADHTIHTLPTLEGLLPFRSAGKALARSYRKHLFGRTMLSDVPASPKFVFNATSLQTGAIWTFEKESMGDPVVGRVRHPTISLAEVVAASSAFPPFLSPLKISLGTAKWESTPQYSRSRPYDDISGRVGTIPERDLQKFRKRVVLIDGGVADNLGIAALWKTSGEMYISDGGGGTPHVASPPVRNWLLQMMRVMLLIHDQPSQLRSDIAKSRFAEHDRVDRPIGTKTLRDDGAYWNMSWPPESHTDVQFPQLPETEISTLAAVKTRLEALDEQTKKRLINWGYAAANRSLPYIKRLWGVRGAKVFSEDALPYSDAAFGPESASQPSR
jgi:NTE family protein